MYDAAFEAVLKLLPISWLKRENKNNQVDKLFWGKPTWMLSQQQIALTISLKWRKIMFEKMSRSCIFVIKKGKQRASTTSLYVATTKKKL